MKKKTCVIVVFRILKTGEVVAVLPRNEKTRGGLRFWEEGIFIVDPVEYKAIVKISRPATSNESRDLLKKIRGLGFKPIVVQKKWMMKKNG